MLGNWHFTLLLKILLDTWKLLDTVIISTLPPVYIFPLGHSWNIFNPIKKKKKSNSESIDSRYLFIFLTSNSLSAGFVACITPVYVQVHGMISYAQNFAITFFYFYNHKK